MEANRPTQRLVVHRRGGIISSLQLQLQDILDGCFAFMSPCIANVVIWTCFLFIPQLDAFADALIDWGRSVQVQVGEFKVLSSSLVARCIRRFMGNDFHLWCALQPPLV